METWRRNSDGERMGHDIGHVNEATGNRDELVPDINV